MDPAAVLNSPALNSPSLGSYAYASPSVGMSMSPSAPVATTPAANLLGPNHMASPYASPVASPVASPITGLNGMGPNGPSGFSGLGGLDGPNAPNLNSPAAANMAATIVPAMASLFASSGYYPTMSGYPTTYSSYPSTYATYPSMQFMPTPMTGAFAQNMYMPASAYTTVPSYSVNANPNTAFVNYAQQPQTQQATSFVGPFPPTIGNGMNMPTMSNGMNMQSGQAVFQRMN